MDVLGKNPSGWLCAEHNHYHTAQIFLIRSHFRPKVKFWSLRRVLDRILTILPHEMSHAWVEIFGIRKGKHILNAVEEAGSTGHVKAFKNVFRMCIWAAHEHFGL